MAVKLTKRELAEMLYVHHQMEQKLIAEKVGVSEKTIYKWKKKYKWDDLRGITLITKPEQLKMLYGQLNEFNLAIKQREGRKYGTPAEMDALKKLTSAIKDLENESGVAEAISVLTKFLEFAQIDDLEFAQKLSTFADAFIKSLLK